MSEPMDRDGRRCGACGGTGVAAEVGPSAAALERAVEARAAALGPDDARRALDKARAFEGGRGRRAPAAVVGGLRTLSALVRDWLSGRYPRRPWRTIAAAAAALLYVVDPFDLMPDFLPVVGWLDDATVLALVARLTARDLADYRAWIGGAASGK